MGFDNLWEKYGDKKGSEKAVESPEREKQEKKEARQQTGLDKAVKKDAPTYKKSDPFPLEYKAKAADAKEKKSGPMPGVFGNNTGNRSEGSRDAASGSPASSGRRDFDWGTMRDWPWVDIICITITIAIVIGVLANFEEVTTALFYTLLPLLSNLLFLLLVVGLIAFIIWWITRRPRRRW